MPNWIPVAILPNIYARRTVEGAAKASGIGIVVQWLVNFVFSVLTLQVFVLPRLVFVYGVLKRRWMVSEIFGVCHFGPLANTRGYNVPMVPIINGDRF